MGNLSHKSAKKKRSDGEESDNPPLFRPLSRFRRQQVKSSLQDSSVDLHDFHILRSVGRGAFGKVCIIQKKDTKHLYGLKYMSKRVIVERSASRNVLKELEILKLLYNPFLVNLCYSFQDDEDMYIVLDLMLGGDIRFHINQGHLFCEQEILLYIVEIGLALEYLKTKRIIHRDLKPDNLLLDSKGHIHLTDFNIATWVPEGKVAVSMSGTRPYMAPEVFATNIGKHSGYSFEADWWSLGVTLCEMMKGSRPFSIHHDMSIESIMKLFTDQSVLNHHRSKLTSSAFKLLTDLLQPNVKKRLCSVEKLKNYSCMKNYDILSVKNKTIQAKFTPSEKGTLQDVDVKNQNDRLNCDPTHELEEMMIESNPLHKKKRKRRPKSMPTTEFKDPVQLSLENLTNKFTSFRRGSEDCSDPTDFMSAETIEILSGRRPSDRNCKSVGPSPCKLSPMPSPRTRSALPTPRKESPCGTRSEPASPRHKENQAHRNGTKLLIPKTLIPNNHSTEDIANRSYESAHKTSIELLANSRTPSSELVNGNDKTNGHTATINMANGNGHLISAVK